MLCLDDSSNPRLHRRRRLVDSFHAVITTRLVFDATLEIEKQWTMRHLVSCDVVATIAVMCILAYFLLFAYLLYRSTTDNERFEISSGRKSLENCFTWPPFPPPRTFSTHCMFFSMHRILLLLSVLVSSFFSFSSSSMSSPFSSFYSSSRLTLFPIHSLCM